MIFGGGARLDETTRQRLEKADVPAELIAQYDEEPTEPVPVWGQHKDVFTLLYRCRGRWRFRQVPAGFGSASVPYELNWKHVSTVMARTPAIRDMDDNQRDRLFEQLEVMEAKACEILTQQFKRA